MTLNSSRLLIANGLVLMLQGIQNNGSPLFMDVKLGSYFDPSPFSSGLCAEVLYFHGQSSPHVGSGGNMVGWRIEDNPIFLINVLTDYELDSTAAMILSLTAMDTLMPVLHSHYQIPNPNSPSQAIASVYSLLENQVDQGRPLKWPNGHVYYVWSTFALCKQQYNVQLVQP